MRAPVAKSLPFKWKIANGLREWIKTHPDLYQLESEATIAKKWRASRMTARGRGQDIEGSGIGLQRASEDIN